MDRECQATCAAKEEKIMKTSLSKVLLKKNNIKNKSNIKSCNTHNLQDINTTPEQTIS